MDDAATAAQRTKLAAGHYRIGVFDRSYECPPMTLDVPAGGDVAYIYAGIVELAAAPVAVQTVNGRLPDM
jgi:hypothetical protein